MNLQTRLSQAVDQFYALHEQGESRHPAVVKVATANSLLPHQIDRLCQTINRAAVDTNRRGEGDLASRLGDPGVLDPQQVQWEVFGRKVAGGHSDTIRKIAGIVEGMEAAEATQLAKVQKTAAAPAVEEEPELVDGGVYGLYAQLSPLEIETTKLALIQDINASYNKIASTERASLISLSATTDYLRKHKFKRDLVKQAEFYAAQHNPELLPVITYFADKVGVALSGKEAAAPDVWAKDLLSNGGFIEQIGLCVKSVKAASAAIQGDLPKIMENRMRLSLLVNTARGSVPKTAVIPGGSYASHQESQIQKIADMTSSFVGSMLGAGHQNGAPKPGLQSDPGVQSFTLQLRNPQHESNLRSIRANAALQELLAKDDVLAAYEPDKIVERFNELSQYAPAATENKAGLRAAIRQMMQNNISVYDLEQFRSLERGSKSKK